MSGFTPFQALMASAGSGKTFSLVVRYLSLLFLGEKPEEIVALTFTNKAANEMQERLVDVLGELPQRDELTAIAALCGVERETILARRSEVLRALLGADTKVMTIDSFFARILRKFSLHAGIMPNFSTYEAQNELKVMARFLRLCEIEGKEHVLVAMAQISARRVSDLFELLDDLYTKAPQLRHLTYKAVPLAPLEQQAMTLYDALAKCFDGKALSAAAEKALRAESFQALLQCSWLEKPSFEYWHFKKHYAPKMDALLQELQSVVKTYMQAKEQTFFAHLLELLALYESAKLGVAKRDGELGFDDITALVHYLLKERIDRDFLYFRLDSRVSHLLLDEFQDTSVQQFDILQPLVEEMIAGDGVREHRSFFIVGDVKQSIYRFRGGSKALFGSVTRRFGLEVDSLRTNWRSSRSVVDFVNAVFRSRIEDYEDQWTKPGAEEGFVEVLQSDAVLESMAERVQAIIAAGGNTDDIAVLTATNKDGEAVQEALSGLGIDVVTETTSKLVNQRRVRAVIEYLKFCYFGEAIYARNFCALADIENVPLPRFSKAFDCPAEAVKFVMERFALFEGDLNLIRFLEVLRRFNDLEAFIFEYERIDAKAVSQDQSGVRVLTVHKSKGLEYPYVIVLDRLGRKRADTAPIIYRYDGTELEGLYLRQSRRAAFDPEYAEALRQEEAAAADDALNALYVAFTRAREQLYIIAKSEGSAFDMLGLEPMTLGSMRVKVVPYTPKRAHDAIPYVPLMLGRQSEVVQTEGEQEREDPFALSYGIALHYALEMMPEFTAEAVATAMTAVGNRYGALFDADVLFSIRKRIERLVSDAAFLALTDGERHRERPLMFEGELRYIDLLVEHEGYWVVIDYKSARRYEDEHRRQVAFYLKAVETITQKKAEGYLCYLLETGVELVKI